MASPFIYLPQRAILSLTGPDTITLLERLVTNATTDWAPATTRYGALLTPQGKVLSDFLAIRTETGVLLDTAAAYVDDLAKRLKMFRLRSQVEIERLAHFVVIAGIEPATQGLQPISGAEQVYLDPRYPGGRLRGLVTEDSWAAWHGPSIAEATQPIADYHADRIAHGIPEQDIDFATAEVFPADINMDVLGGVALNKGCFVGQEVVSRMHRRGQIRKRSLAITGAPDALFSSGDDVIAAAPIGTVTSQQGANGLARIRVDRWQKAEADQIPIRIHETPVTIAKPDWLVAEQSLMKDS